MTDKKKIVRIINVADCSIRSLQWAQIAQLVEQRTENPRVTGSIPVLGISYCHKLNMGYGALAQSVEHLTFNQVVGGSNPPCFSIKNRPEPLIIRSSGLF